MPTSPPLPSELQHRNIQLDDVDLHLVLAGPEQGPPVLLLHGFPEFWFGWRNQLGPLADAGFRVIVPDQRGYNLSGKPRPVSAYSRCRLAADMTGLLDRLGYASAAVVGHDWGGAVAWWMALQHPARVQRLAALNLPHPVVMARALRFTRQTLRSWYMLAFQAPRLPELLLGRERSQPLIDLLVNSARPGAFSDDDLERYREAFEQPGALTGMLAWYRALLRTVPARLKHKRAGMPVQLIWGARDRALGVEMAAPSLDFCDRGALQVIQHAGHFVQHDAWPEVNTLLLEFLKK